MAEIIYNALRNAWEYRQMLRSPYIDYFNGRFFVTFQAAHNKSVFGAIVGDECVLNELGEAVKAAWLAEPNHVAGLEIFEFVVMPNHFHAILEYHEPAGRGGPAATRGDPATAPGRSGGPAATCGDPATAPGRSEAATAFKYTRAPDARDLPYVIGLFKSYTTNLYLKLKVSGKCLDIGPKLWQESFYDELIRDERQYRETAHYIRQNPANWNSDRFGAVTSFAEGNVGLLQCEYIAYLSSEGIESRGDPATAPGRLVAKRWPSTATTPAGRGGPAATATTPAATRGDPATAPGRSEAAPSPASRPPVVSTFTSYYERQLLERCLAEGRRFIWVCPGGIGAAALAKTAAAREAGLALLISPVAPETGVNKQRAIWCNQFITKNAAEIWVGHIRPGGSLETILTATTPAGRGGPAATRGDPATAPGRSSAPSHIP